MRVGARATVVRVAPPAFKRSTRRLSSWSGPGSRISAGRLSRAASRSAGGWLGSFPAPKTPRGTAHESPAEPLPAPDQGEQEVVRRAFQELGVGDGAGGDHPHHLPADQLPPLPRRLPLLAAPHLLPPRQQP